MAAVGITEDAEEDAERPLFGHVDSWLWYKTWDGFLKLESFASVPESPDDASPEEHRDILVRAGLRVLEVVLDLAAKTAMSNSRAYCSFKPRSQVWRSRTDPAADCYRKALTISFVEPGKFYFDAGSTLPDDASTGVWRLDLGDDTFQINQMRRNVKAFAMNTQNPMHQLIVRDLQLNREALTTALLPLPHGHNRSALQVLAAKLGLNDKQSEALRQCIANKLNLIQGPPGTGKTLVAKAIACIVEFAEGYTLLTAPSKTAVDYLMITASTGLHNGLARDVSKAYEARIRSMGHEEKLTLLRSFLYPEMVREALGAQNYTRYTKR